MYAYPGVSYRDAYDMPIPIRRWFIKTFNKRQEKENGNNPNINKPLSPIQKNQIRNQQKAYSNDPAVLKGIFQPQKK